MGMRPRLMLHSHGMLAPEAPKALSAPGMQYGKQRKAASKREACRNWRGLDTVWDSEQSDSGDVSCISRCGP